MYREISSRINNALGSDLEDQLLQALIYDVLTLKGPAWVARAIMYYALSEEDDELAKHMVRVEMREKIRYGKEQLDRIFDADRATEDDRRVSIDEVISRAWALELLDAANDDGLVADFIHNR